MRSLPFFFLAYASFSVETTDGWVARHAATSALRLEAVQLRLHDCIESRLGTTLVPEIEPCWAQLFLSHLQSVRLALAPSGQVSLSTSATGCVLIGRRGVGLTVYDAMIAATNIIVENGDLIWLVLGMRDASLQTYLHYAHQLSLRPGITSLDVDNLASQRWADDISFFKLRVTRVYLTVCPSALQKNHGNDIAVASQPGSRPLFYHR